MAVLHSHPSFVTLGEEKIQEIQLEKGKLTGEA
jgi:hypothetical protein